MTVNFVIVALGANATGRWGAAATALGRVPAELRALEVKIVRISSIFVTKPIGPVRQPSYYNAVAIIQANLSAAVLLRSLKRIERAAGRRLGVRWGPRPLDLDLVSFRGARHGWPARRRTPGRLILPHPEMHRRAFVLGPLSEIAPGWRHPVLGVPARTLWLRLPASARRGIVRAGGSAKDLIGATGCAIGLDE